MKVFILSDGAKALVYRFLDGPPQWEVLDGPDEGTRTYRKGSRVFSEYPQETFRISEKEVYLLALKEGERVIPESLWTEAELMERRKFEENMGDA